MGKLCNDNNMFIFDKNTVETIPYTKYIADLTYQQPLIPKGHKNNTDSLWDIKILPEHSVLKQILLSIILMTQLSILVFINGVRKIKMTYRDVLDIRNEKLPLSLLQQISTNFVAINDVKITQIILWPIFIIQS